MRQQKWNCRASVEILLAEPRTVVGLVDSHVVWTGPAHQIASRGVDSAECSNR